MVAAAKSLGMDDSTVSRRIARLEAELGIALVSRAGRRTALTEKGRELANVASELESIVLRKVTAGAHSGTALNGIVRVGAPEGLGVGYLAEQLAKISSANSNLEIELVALPRNYSLAAREVDIAISLDRPTTGQVTAFRLTPYTLALHGTDQYFKQHGKPKTLADLKSHTFAGYIPELLFTSELDFIRLAPGLEVKASIRSTSVLAQVNAVECGAAIGVLPTFLTNKNKALKIILAGEVMLERAYWLSVHDDLKIRPRVKYVVGAIRSAVKRDRGRFLYRA